MKIDPTNTTQKRLRILGDDEIEALYALPHFTQEEQAQYFTLSQIRVFCINPRKGALRG